MTAHRRLDNGCSIPTCRLLNYIKEAHAPKTNDMRKPILILGGLATVVCGAWAQQSDADLKAKIVGYWSSGRHIYDYRADGSWYMCPVSPDSTHGHWTLSMVCFMTE